MLDVWEPPAQSLLLANCTRAEKSNSLSRSIFVLVKWIAWSTLVYTYSVPHYSGYVSFIPRCLKHRIRCVVWEEGETGPAEDKMWKQSVGKALRSIGQSLDGVGVSLEGALTYTEHCTCLPRLRVYSSLPNAVSVLQ